MEELYHSAYFGGNSSRLYSWPNHTGDAKPPAYFRQPTSGSNGIYGEWPLPSADGTGPAAAPVAASSTSGAANSGAYGLHQWSCTTSSSCLPLLHRVPSSESSTTTLHRIVATNSGAGTDGDAQQMTEYSPESKPFLGRGGCADVLIGSTSNAPGSGADRFYYPSDGGGDGIADFAARHCLAGSIGQQLQSSSFDAIGDSMFGGSIVGSRGASLKQLSGTQRIQSKTRTTSGKFCDVDIACVQLDEVKELTS